VEQPEEITSIADPVLTEGGAIAVAEGVIAAVALKEAVETEGIVKVDGRDRDEVLSLLRRGELPRSWSKAAKVDGGAVSLEVQVVVSYGTNIPEVGKAMREQVSRAVEDYTGFTVKALDVKVAGVQAAPPKEEPAGDADASDSP